MTNDETEKTVMLYTIVTVVQTESKGWRTRRIKDFERWLEKRRVGVVHPAQA